MKHICMALIRFYRKFLSPLKSKPCCRFTPTCSAYALAAFEKRGFFVGFYLTVTRIFRCNPFCPGGYDPVPLTGLRNKKGGDDETFQNGGGDGGRFVFIYELELDDREKSPKKKKKRED